MGEHKFEPDVIVPDQDLSQKYPLERPGCVTVYALLNGLGGLIFLCAAPVAGLLLVEDYGPVALVLSLFAAALALLPLAMSVGLWRMRRWGWILVVITNGTSILTSLLAFFAGLLGGATDLIVQNLLGIVLNGFILYWFIANRGLFGIGSKRAGASGRDNWMVILATIGGGVLILALFCVVAIALLTLLGPQIGNVFSQITSGLETP